MRDVELPQHVHRIASQHGGIGDIGDARAIWAMEYQHTVGLSFDLIALLMHRAVMPPTQHREVRQCRRAAARPVADVMPLADTHSTAWEATPAVSMVKRAPERRRNRPSTRSDLNDPAVGVVTHHHAGRIAREPLRRSRGNAHAVFEDGLARVIGIGQDVGGPVLAAAPGVVSFAGGDPSFSYGYYVIVDHGLGVTTLYGHMALPPVVRTGQLVAQGSLLGLSGSSGFSTGPHVHFEIRLKGVPVDPLPLLRKAVGG